MKQILDMYCKQKMSIPQVSKATGISLSTIRFRLFKAGVLRSRIEAIRIAASEGRMIGKKGQTVVMSEQHKQNLSKAKIKWAEKNAKGVSLKPNGYLAYTRGIHKSRSVHVVAMEIHIGRKLYANECVHHIDRNKTNNDLSNLQLMTRAEHAAHHGKENEPKRKRKKDGKFE